MRADDFAPPAICQQALDEFCGRFARQELKSKCSGTRPAGCKGVGIARGWSANGGVHVSLPRHLSLWDQCPARAVAAHRPAETALRPTIPGRTARTSAHERTSKL